MSIIIEIPEMGLEIEVDESGRFYLPDRLYSPADLKKIARAVNRALSQAKYESSIE